MIVDVVQYYAVPEAMEGSVSAAVSFSSPHQETDFSTGYLEDALVEFGERTKRRRLLLPCIDDDDDRSKSSSIDDLEKVVHVNCLS